LPGGSCEGVLAETHEGRPTKLEGNPLHPVNRGRSTKYSQASVLELYDPDRDAMAIAKFAEGQGAAFGVTAWAEFQKFAAGHFAAFDATKGEKLAFLVEKATSPSRDRLRDQILSRWPKATWRAYEAIDNDAALEGSANAFGGAFRQKIDLGKARVILSLGSDFLGGEESTLELARGWGEGRYRPGADAAHEARDSKMNRLYVAEANFTLTGGQADHRLPLKPSRIGALALAVAANVMKSKPGGALAGAVQAAAAACSGADVPAEWAKACADDLLASGGECVVLVGNSQPAAVHALGHALNEALGASGKTVTFVPVSGDAAEPGPASIAALAADIDAGRVDTLVTIGCNPAYDAPADLDFAAKLKKVAHSVHLGAPDETGQSSKMHIARSHYLEAWGDVESWDGTLSVVQPMIKPLYESVGELEFLATILGEKITDPYEIVRTTLAGRWKIAKGGADGIANPAFEKSWRRALHDGITPNIQTRSASPRADLAKIGAGLPALAEMCKPNGEIEAMFVASMSLFDGRHANNGWLQEVPDPITKAAWGNPLLVGPGTAKKIGVGIDRRPKTPQYNHGKIVSVTIGGRSVQLPVYVLPGIPDDTVILTLGYGRTFCGRVGNFVGANTYAVRAAGGLRIAKGAKVEAVAGAKPELVASTQDHWSMEGRGIIREVDLAAWQKHGDIDISNDKEIQLDPYDSTRGLNFAGRLDIESHTPANKDIYLKNQQHYYVEVDPVTKLPLRDGKGHVIPKKGKYGRPHQQWGMTIDLNTCTGCGACTVACQAENNIPIVGKMEVAKGREMHWIRVDRYFASDSGRDEDYLNEANPDMVVQPMLCVQCENAPCEVVCPVNATVHDPEGLNNMAYNRCIGTKYCSNNCPYKVRRFNWFDYATKQFHGTYGQLGEVMDGKVPMPSNENFIPPRLRQKILEVSTMQRNPHVTVRSRGVMEKCTFCIQRINAARVEMKLNDLDKIPDGYLQTACQQACPSGAIVFGDIYDFEANAGKGSAVSQLRNNGRSYGVLAYLNTRPRTTHLLRLRNPNPSIRKPNDEPFHHHGDHGDHGHGEHAGAPHHDEKHVMSLPILSMNAGGVA
jgi:Fe-S-cluster-containing dehydrogenase component